MASAAASGQHALFGCKPLSEALQAFLSPHKERKKEGWPEQKLMDMVSPTIQRLITEKQLLATLLKGLTEFVTMLRKKGISASELSNGGMVQPGLASTSNWGWQ